MTHCLLLRLLQTVHEDIVSPEVSTFDAQAASSPHISPYLPISVHQAASRVKDAMREQCVSRVVEALDSPLADS